MIMTWVPFAGAKEVKTLADQVSINLDAVVTVATKNSAIIKAAYNPVLMKTFQSVSDCCSNIGGSYSAR